MRAFVLIIGSLWWDKGDRAKWRAAHLAADKKILVNAPIHYARQSESRGNTYTMTFGATKEGVGILVPYQKVETMSEVIAQAEALWAAEQPSARPGRIGSSWGCVGAAFHKRAARDLVTGWSNLFQSRQAPIKPVDGDGILQIPWPHSLGHEIEADLILATATKANSPSPNAITIADAWIGQQEGFEGYFFNNVHSGIRTNDDAAIWKRIEHCAPRWLSGDYHDAVAVLQEEASLQPPK